MLIALVGECFEEKELDAVEKMKGRWLNEKVLLNKSSLSGGNWNKARVQHHDK